ncbi:23S rRNA (adenine(2503)-C(2))-methyltransferase RlmN [Buchnera aphidicola]|uniref:Dual-specificity RNA methyltransferase RlmN n=1 Tax=Buchnera aphidicola (Sarucallis kahawaluokalani) TaxID=1241878 RepID=A0A4D6Y9D3_9GAMM|nr:23S rRNA (adenine(2503)-C(2))-methyltransferase RlmN [Buchnera aphidicola]QCI25989.1 23S rRNA (adenine(2503)-C(2))-methyltransferase RlmN [Buchnera aphidicola (Sarucallis kahawaluokalani)]
MLYNQKNKKINLINYDHFTMQNFMYEINEKKFRADQIMYWIYQRLCNNFDNMINLPLSLRNKLKNISVIQFPIATKEIISSDHTIKWIFSADNGVFETVYIPENNRGTLCISSQVGCILRCKFCATGMQGFKRNLLVSEMIGQIWVIYNKMKYDKNIFRYPITNIVFMGMGEPLLNFNNVFKTLNIIFSKHGFHIPKKKVILSTAGIVPAINKLSNIFDVKLALSLHAPNDILRNQLMPINKKYNIKLLLSSVEKFLKRSRLNRKGVTIEYIMLKNINDTIQHAKELIKILKNLPSKINLIPWNYLPDVNFSCSSFYQMNLFSNFLMKHGFFVTIRKPRGQDIQAACGQLTGLVY